jgi:hypothetical protein
MADPEICEADRLSSTPVCASGFFQAVLIFCCTDTEKLRSLLLLTLFWINGSTPSAPIAMAD